MPEYIERNKAISEARYEFGNAGAKVMARIPAADVAPVVHGRWIRIDNPAYSPFDYSPPYLYLCDQCHKKEESEKRFCPSCGALMDLEGPQP